MEVKIIQAFLIGIIYYLSVNGTPWLTLLGSTIMARPLICGTFVGLVLGDVTKGVIIGAAITIPYLGYISAGGSLPMDPGLAGTLGTALAIISGSSPEVAVTLAVPIGLLGQFVWVAHMTMDITFLHIIDQSAENLDDKKIDLAHTIYPQIFLFLITVIPVFIIVYFGSGYVTNLLDVLDGTPMHILEVIGGVLPAIGIAMILKSTVNKKIFVFYILGFILSVYMELPIIVVSILGFIIASVYTNLYYLKSNA
ncbi:PTS sugar transporter subunit IIC [uncultured Helcococcus sp.]|uniref:PTS mannose/fructose/sorbose/N-acetylgalactosamine transporter subunit IIC n=1 Tax=uncultured Helcococcus sp. TaxID=1072508 RepID=UPI00288C31FA|nr:PTS sugar transporter subunit IIC [uncultured Helcococcus sp.]